MYLKLSSPVATGELKGKKVKRSVTPRRREISSPPRRKGFVPWIEVLGKRTSEAGDLRSGEGR